ncbi:MAG: hypothetical protein M4579_001204 [Chaenotheca gracillima]|nr:MAG: hypothetical protein M4579_001204 [Chaenotheca gracillima]
MALKKWAANKPSERSAEIRRCFDQLKVIRKLDVSHLTHVAGAISESREHWRVEGHDDQRRVMHWHLDAVAILRVCLHSVREIADHFVGWEAALEAVIGITGEGPDCRLLLHQLRSKSKKDEIMLASGSAELFGPFYLRWGGHLRNDFTGAETAFHPPQ